MGIGQNKGNATAWVVAAGDVLCISLAYGLALLMRFDFSFKAVPAEYLAGFAQCIAPIVLSAMLIMWWRGLYRSIWSFVSMFELTRLLQAWALEILALVIYSLSVGPSMPRSFWCAGTMLAFAFTSAIRFSWRLERLFRRGKLAQVGKKQVRVMIIGGGEAGRELLREMSSADLGLRAVCVIDDNPAKQGRLIDGVPIVGTRYDIPRVVKEYRVKRIFVAVPSADGSQRKDIIERCQSTGLDVLVVPGIYQFLDGQLSVSKLRDVNLEDLLGRDPVSVDPEGIHDLVHGHCVLVTGGGGSIGSEICRQVAKEQPSRLIIFDIYENNAYDIQQELRHDYPELDLRVLIGSVRDVNRVREVFSAHRPNVVFHAAAHKHVPLMEDSPKEAVKNNVFGTANVVNAACEFGAARFVLISTDKAVNPTNVMGATKRICEMVVQSKARKVSRGGLKTTYSAVRFGNVLGSNGSVVPLFERQIAEGGPVTVTDPRITRYFMTIPEAVSLVLQAACYAHGGEVFVLDMGEPVCIDDMARKLIRLAGYEPDKEIEIKYTGLRPGEKLYEERLMSEEGLAVTANSKISVARPIAMDDEVFGTRLEALDKASKTEDENAIRSLIAATVPTYHPELGGKGAVEKGAS